MVVIRLVLEDSREGRAQGRPRARGTHGTGTRSRREGRLDIAVGTTASLFGCSTDRSCRSCTHSARAFKLHLACVSTGCAVGVGGALAASHSRRSQISLGE